MEWLSRKTSIAYADVGAIFARGYPKFGMTLYSARWNRAQATTCGHCRDPKAQRAAELAELVTNVDRALMSR
jgi:hypothetical protein